MTSVTVTGVLFPSQVTVMPAAMVPVTPETATVESPVVVAVDTVASFRPLVVASGSLEFLKPTVFPSSVEMVIDTFPLDPV